MILVDILEEWLDSSLLNELFLINSPLDALGVSGDAHNQQMWEFELLYD